MRLSLKFTPHSFDVSVPPSMSKQLATPADPILCHCLQVYESTVQDCVTLLGAGTVQEVRAACGAGSGCMSCRRRIQALIERRENEELRCQEWPARAS